MTEPSTRKVHPAADLFPLMDTAELKELAADIKKNGLIAGIVRDKDGVILDGRNRLEACRMAGVEPRFVQYNDNDPVGFIVAANIHRRHLTSKQKSELVKKLLKLNPEKSDRQIAATAKADHKTVAKERRKAVARGEIPHVPERTDAKGRQQPATKSAPRSIAKAPATPTGTTLAISTPPKGHRDSPACLAEFKTACDHWLPRLNADDLKKARTYFQDRADAREKTNGARPTGSAEQSLEERRELNDAE
jgi:ParB-like chromosome segregation protein Spo0J